MRRLPLVICVLLLFTAVGCQTGPLAPMRPTSHPPAAVPVEPMPPLPELAPLAGRRIVLDPGHGGPWPGAIAPSNALRESDVNLAVAQAAAALLRDAGAEVTLTRETDTALTGGGLSSDLAERAALANRLLADVFVSIHHNADIAPDSGKNDLEVYYKLGEDGASLTLAQEMTYALAAWLRRDATPKRLLPGNYKVLRLAEVPAVLLESSYLTAGPNAAYLAAPEGIEAEAKAIVAGLALYFGLNPPQVDAVSLKPLQGGRHHALRVQLAQGAPLDPRWTTVTIDGIPGQTTVAGDALVWVGAVTLPNGEHTARIRATSMKGAAATAVAAISVERPAASMYVRQYPLAPAPDSGIEIRFEAEVRDALGYPVADGTRVLLEETGAEAATSGGKATFYLAPSAEPLTFTADGVYAKVPPQYGMESWRTARCVDAVNGALVPGVLVESEHGVRTVSTAEGWLCLPEQRGPITLRKAGYLPAQTTLVQPNTEILLEPVAGGTLHGKRIVLDPAGGGRDPVATGPHGMRASDVNLAVATSVASRLIEAGAEVALTREDDMELTDLQRLAHPAVADANLLLSISYGTPESKARVLDASGKAIPVPASFAGHYPGSSGGSRLANAISGAFGGVPAVPCVAYLVQQTPCPAVLVQPADMTARAIEERYRQAAACRADADALYNALLEYFRPPAAPPSE